MILRKLALHAAVLGTLLTGTMACVPTGDITFTYEGFNDRLRPDRAPLSQEQTALAGHLEQLRYGPYRAGLAELAVPLRPAHEFVTNLPQSDCWWMGQSATGGRDSLRANWEEVALVTGDEGVLERFHDEEDGQLDIGLCRLNDPQTRAFVHNKNDDSTTSEGTFELRKLYDLKTPRSTKTTPAAEEPGPPAEEGNPAGPEEAPAAQAQGPAAEKSAPTAEAPEG